MIDQSSELEKVVWDGVFSLEVPRDWVIHEEDNIISIFDEENGVGVIQISLVERNSSEAPTKLEARELAVYYIEQRKWEVQKDSITMFEIGESPASVFDAEELSDEGLDHWTVWHISGSKNLAFLTYNCLLADKHTELSMCDSIVKSFRWL